MMNERWRVMILLMYLFVKLKDCFNSGVYVFGLGVGVISFKKRILLGLEFRYRSIDFIF